MTTIKRMNGMMEIKHVEGNRFFYIRRRVDNKEVLNTMNAIADSFTTVEEPITVEIPKFNTHKEKTVSEESAEKAQAIRDRVAREMAAKIEADRRNREIKLMLHRARKFAREAERTRKPANVAEVVMDRLGIDRVAVYDVLNRIDRKGMGGF